MVDGLGFMFKWNIFKSKLNINIITSKVNNKPQKYVLGVRISAYFTLLGLWGVVWAAAIANSF